MIESDFTKRVNEKLDPRKIKVWKIKDDYQGGVPDALYLPKISHSAAQTCVFVEYKFIKALPKLDKTCIIPALSELQKEWLRIASLTLPCFVIVGYKDTKAARGVVYTSNEWLTGIPKADFVNRLWSYQEIADFLTLQIIGS